MLDNDSDVSRFADRLVQKNLVSRIENPEDRRPESVDITELGMALPDKMFNCEQKPDTSTRPVFLNFGRFLSVLVQLMPWALMA